MAHSWEHRQRDIRRGPQTDGIGKIESSSYQNVQSFSLSILWVVMLPLSQFSFHQQQGHVLSVCPLHVSLQMHQRPSVPTHHRGLSSLADVTHLASVIERDVNPAPLQSRAVGWGGTGRYIERDMRKEVGYRRQRSICRHCAGTQTQHWSGQVRQVLSYLTKKTRGVSEGLGPLTFRLRPGGQKPHWGLCRGGMLWELLMSCCTPSCVTCIHCRGAGLHHCGAVPRWRYLSDSKWGVRGCWRLC